MDLREVRVVLRERRLLDVLDLAVRFLVSHAAPYAVVSAFVLVPAGVITVMIAAHAGFGWALAAALVLSALAEVPFTLLGSRLVFESDVSYGPVFRNSLRRAPVVLLTRSLAFVAAAIGATMFLLPGVWISITFLYLTEVVALEGAGVSPAMTRAQRMLTGRFGDALLAWMALGGIHLGATWVGDRALAIVLGELFQITPPAPLGEPDGGVLGLVAFWLAVPYVATARLFSYIDLRTRTEGWDVQVRFGALAQRDAQREAAER
jgi:hypothetical protein